MSAVNKVSTLCIGAAVSLLALGCDKDAPTELEQPQFSVDDDAHPDNLNPPAFHEFEASVVLDDQALGGFIITKVGDNLVLGQGGGIGLQHDPDGPGGFPNTEDSNEGAFVEEWCLEFDGPSGNTNGCNGVSFTQIPGPPVLNTSTPGELQATGSATLIGAGGSVQVDQIVGLRNQSNALSFEVTLTNVGSSPLTNVEYLRNHDPDIGIDLGVGFTTDNQTVNRPQPGPSAPPMFVAATVRPTGETRTVGLGTPVLPPASGIGDVSIHTSSLEHRDPDQVISGSGVTRGPLIGDVGNAIAWRIPALDPGDAVTIDFCYSFTHTPANVDRATVAADMVEVFETDCLPPGPLPDTDEDGTPNRFDDCPNEFGPPDNNGCPRPEVPEGTPIPNGPSSCEIEVDGRFGTNACVEWADITPIVSLGGESIVYQALDEEDGEFIYLMYDWIGSGTPLQPGDASGQVRFFVGADVFDVTFVQGGANSTGELNDDVTVLRNGLPFDNSDGAIVGAVDRNNTSPNFAPPHNLFELKVRLLETAETPGGSPPEEGGLYSPDPAFWSAALPGSPLTRVSSVFLDIGAGGVVTSTREEALEVDVDIKPGGNPNCIQAASKGRTPVAILATEDLDVTDIDVSSITLSGVGPPVRSSVDDDVNGDGRPDLVMHFETQDLASAGLLDDDGRILVITGYLSDHTPIIGEGQIFLAGGPNCFD